MLAALALAAAVVAVPDGATLKEAIAASDADFFGTFFTGCAPARIEAMVTSDFEMYHDKGGFVYRDGPSFVADYAKSCAERKKPDAWRSRRELVAGSMTVHRIEGYGAIEQGDHLFYERKGNGPEKLVGKARFTQLWRLEGSTWKLARVFSYDHEAVKQTAARQPARRPAVLRGTFDVKHCWIPAAAEGTQTD